MAFRKQLLDTAPSDHELKRLTAMQRREAAVALIDGILGGMAREMREPDAWEGSALASAVGCLACGWSRAALALAMKAIAPGERRGEPPLGDALDDFSLAALRRGLSFARRARHPDGW